jgi:hypothetical protein
VRLSPQKVFLALVALGLPFAATIGWQLAAPAPAPAARSTPGGAASFGSAPVPSATSASPLTVVDWPAPPAKAIVPAPARTSPSSAPVAPSTSAAPPPSSAPPLPSRPTSTLPPVPTPTDASSAPSTPADPSSSSADDDWPLGAGRLVRRP